MLFNIVVTETVHIPGEENVICDRLSRQKATPQTFGIGSHLLTDLSDSSTLYSLLTLVDPTSSHLLETEEDFCVFWRQAHHILNKISSEHTLLDTPPLSF
jgi:hypothetical protein